MVLGTHLIKTWSKTQSVIAKSSAESEMYGVSHGTCEGLGVLTLLRELGVCDVTAQLHMDANAATGIVESNGISKIRQLDAGGLWLQQQQLRNAMPLNKIKRRGQSSRYHDEECLSTSPP